jgi:hypothetical protein
LIIKYAIGEVILEVLKAKKMKSNPMDLKQKAFRSLAKG